MGDTALSSADQPSSCSSGCFRRSTIWGKVGRRRLFGFLNTHNTGTNSVGYSNYTSSSPEFDHEFIDGSRAARRRWLTESLTHQIRNLFQNTCGEHTSVCCVSSYLFYCNSRKRLSSHRPYLIEHHSIAVAVTEGRILPKVECLK